MFLIIFQCRLNYARNLSIQSERPPRLTEKELEQMAQYIINIIIVIYFNFLEKCFTFIDLR